MKIIACPECHTQYDVSNYAGDTVKCPCGTLVPMKALSPRTATIHRCGSCGAAVTSNNATCPYCSSRIEQESTQFTLICPECYARNHEMAGFCADCGVRFEPQEPPAEENLLNCPVCTDRRMEARAVTGLTLQECTACGGLWVPEDRLDRLVEQAVKAAAHKGAATVVHRPLQRMARVTYRKCPVCQDAMQRKNFGRTSGVILDWCCHHGTWLDADELEAIAAFVMSQGGTAEHWKLHSTDQRFRAIAAQYDPGFSSPNTPLPHGRHSIFKGTHIVGGEDVVEGFVDWISDLLSDT